MDDDEEEGSRMRWCYSCRRCYFLGWLLDPAHLPATHSRPNFFQQLRPTPLDPDPAEQIRRIYVSTQSRDARESGRPIRGQTRVEGGAEASPNPAASDDRPRQPRSRSSDPVLLSAKATHERYLDPLLTRASAAAL